MCASDPTEKAIIAKERASGSYRLSAYYMSKVIADLPLNFALPTLMYLVFFAASGIGGVVEFIITYPILLLQVLVSQVGVTGADRNIGSITRP